VDEIWYFVGSSLYCNNKSVETIKVRKVIASSSGILHHLTQKESKVHEFQKSHVEFLPFLAISMSSSIFLLINTITSNEDLMYTISFFFILCLARDHRTVTDCLPYVCFVIHIKKKKVYNKAWHMFFSLLFHTKNVCWTKIIENKKWISKLNAPGNLRMFIILNNLGVLVCFFMINLLFFLNAFCFAFVTLS
jgi:hypothetical protein